MFLLVGLGNPGERYLGTRHNIGFQFLEFLAEEHGLSFTQPGWRPDLAVASLRLLGEAVLLAKPLPFMNLSGLPVAALVARYSVATSSILVVHDDLDLERGRAKFSVGGGDGGHRGIRSLIEHLGDPSFCRLRVGIGRPAEGRGVVDHVLAPFSGEEHQVVRGLFPVMARAVASFLADGPGHAMNFLNSRRP